MVLDLLIFLHLSIVAFILCFQTMLIWGQHVEGISVCPALALLIQVPQIYILLV